MAGPRTALSMEVRGDEVDERLARSGYVA